MRVRKTFYIEESAIKIVRDLAYHSNQPQSRVLELLIERTGKKTLENILKEKEA